VALVKPAQQEALEKAAEDKATAVAAGMKHKCNLVLLETLDESAITRVELSKRKAVEGRTLKVLGRDGVVLGSGHVFAEVRLLYCSLITKASIAVEMGDLFVHKNVGYVFFAVAFVETHRCPVFLVPVDKPTSIYSVDLTEFENLIPTLEYFVSDDSTLTVLMQNAQTLTLDYLCKMVRDGGRRSLPPSRFADETFTSPFSGRKEDQGAGLQSEDAECETDMSAKKEKIAKKERMTKKGATDAKKPPLPRALKPIAHAVDFGKGIVWDQL
jgi:hypothetical protein